MELNGSSSANNSNNNSNKRPKSATLTYVISPRPSSTNDLNIPVAGSKSNSRPSSPQRSNSSSNHSLQHQSSQQPQASGKGIAHFRFSHKIKRLGISRTLNSSISYERILAGNWSEFDRIFTEKYHLHPVESVHFRPRSNFKKFQKKAQIHDTIFEEVAEAVEKVCREANRKRRKLRSLCLANPFLPVVYKNYIIVTSTIENILSECFANEHQQYVWFPRISILSIGMVPMFLLLFLLVGLLLGTLLGFVYDILTMRYFLRFSGYEQRWIKELFAANPDLDGQAVDTVIKNALQQACDTLMRKIPDSDLRVWGGIERFDHWNLFIENYHEFKEEFFIIIDPGSESFGQLMYHF